MRGMPRVIWVLGLASLLNDVSSEAIFPLLPVFLTSLGAPIAYIGLIEGSADALASTLKVVAGRLSDRARAACSSPAATYSRARARRHRGRVRCPSTCWRRDSSIAPARGSAPLRATR